MDWETDDIVQGGTRRFSMMSGTGVATRQQIMAFLAPLFAERAIALKSKVHIEAPDEPKPLTEIEQWNRAVEQRKAEKKAKKGKV